MATINGTAGNDNLAGTGSNDTINGLGGNDTLAGSAGTDFYDGGAGFDTLDLRATLTGLTANLSAGTLSGGFNGTFASIERVWSGDGNDSLTGTAGADSFSARGGNDSLAGGAGIDTLWGGTQADTFIFRETGTANADSIGDWASGSDKLLLGGTAMTALGAAGNFAAGDARFAANISGTAQDASDRVIYETDTRQIWYDADGNGAGARQLIATLQVGATLVATDIVVEGSTPPSGGQVINGTPGNDSLTGSDGNDTINGLAGSDTLIGNEGDDVLDGGEGLDTMDGGLGNDTYYSERLASGFLQGDVLIDAGGTDTLITHGGTLPDGIENMTLRPADEPFFEINAGGNALNNFIRNESDMAAWLDGAEGDDTIIGGTGVDYLFLSDGNDSIDGGGSVNRLFANSAVVIDFRIGTAASAGGTTSFTDIDEAYGSFFNDQLIADDLGRDLDGGGGDDTVTGGAGGDSLRGDGGFDHLDTIEGDDLIFGGAGNDFLAGGDGSDTLDGGAGNDTLRGVGELSNDPEGFPDGADRFLFTVAPGSANADLIQDFTLAEDEIVLDGTVHANSGASGNFTAGDGRFWASGTGAAHDADDRVIYNTSNGQLWYDADGSGAGTAQLIATLRWFDSPASLAATDIEIINGSASGQVINGTTGNDSLAGTSGNDTINGLAGNDTLVGGAGSDFYDGGAGFDTLDLRFTLTNLSANLSAGTLSGGFNGTFVNIERVWSGDGNDTLTGTAAANSFSARGGNDTLAGAGGVDTLWGGTQADTFVFRESGTANADSIGDWASGSDKLHLDDSAFAAIGAAGNFAAGDGRFWAAAGATAGHDANDRVVYNTSTGSLYYDADGSGAGAAQLIATVQSGATVAATDIVVI